MDYIFESLIPSFVYMVNRHANEDYFIPPEARQHHNLMIIVEGEGYYLDGNKEVPIKKNDVIYNVPNQVYGYRTSKKHLLHAYGINFDVASVKMEQEGVWTLERVDKLPFEHMFTLAEPSVIQKLLKGMLSHWHNNKVSYNIECRKDMMKLLMLLYRQVLNPKEYDKKRQVAAMSKIFIEENYKEPLTLADIANHINLSPSYFGKLFRDVTGKTPIEYLQSVRVEKAEDLLIERYPINEIATMIGFQNPFYFSKVFKKHKGQCPRDYINSASKLL